MSDDAYDGARLAALYQEMILDHYRRPRNKGALERATGEAALKNPLCGDELAVQVALVDDRVADVRFTGRGCSISQASASMMTELVRDRSAAEVEELARLVAAMLRGDEAAAQSDRLGAMRALSGVARFPTRHRCASLAWEALARALRGPMGPGTREQGPGPRAGRGAKAPPSGHANGG